MENEEQLHVDDYEKYLQDNIIRDQELLAFVDEFLNSSEMLLYAPKEKEALSVPKRIEQIVPLSEKLRRVRKFEELFRNFMKRKYIKEIVTHQENAISVIRKKISDEHKRYICHQEERKEMYLQEAQQALEELRYIFNENLQYLRVDSTAFKKIQYYKNQRLQKQEERKRREIEIEKKLSNECKRKKQIEKIKNKRYDEKVIQKTKSKPVMVIESELTLEETTLEVIEENIEENVETIDTLRINLEEKEQILRDTSPKKEPVKGKESKGKAENKKDEKNVKEPEVSTFVMPYIPIVNPRKKITSISKTQIPEITVEVEKLKSIELENQKFVEKVQLMKNVPFSRDTSFTWSPNKIKFADYRINKIYNCKVIILNGSTSELRCRFYVIKLNEFKPCLIEVLPMDIQTVIPGKSFVANIKFTPEDLKETIKGEVVFLSYKTTKKEYKYFSIPIECTPICSNIVLSPPVIVFESMPIWQAKRKRHENFKLLKISNVGKQTCNVVVSRVESLYNVDSSSLSTSNEFENIHVVNEEELIEEDESQKFSFAEKDADLVYGPFKFDSYSFNLPGKSEEIVKIFFYNVDYVGSYNEAYSIDVYEENECGNFECLSNQELIVKASTTGKFIIATPDVLDFGVCVFGSVYQLRFKVYNSTKLPHGIGLKFPSHLKQYLKSSENDVYIEANTEDEFGIKFFPSEQIKSDKLSCYCSETGILEFKIYVTVLSKKFLDTPPTKIAVFAILTESNGMSLRPVDNDITMLLKESSVLDGCTNSSDGDYLVDLGECTCVEKVLTNIELTNNSATVQNYGFLDLPKSVQILPNHGFGEIGPFETIALTLAYSASTEDIPNYLLNCGKCSKHVTFSITVDTIYNIGRLREGFGKKLTVKVVQKLAEKMKKELKNQERNSLITEMLSFIELYRKDLTWETFQESCIDYNKSEEEKEDEAEEEDFHPNTPVSTSVQSSQLASTNSLLSYDYEDTEKVNPKSNKLWIKATIVDNFCEISHQYIKFADTPSGSYSHATVELSASGRVGNLDEECVCGYAKMVNKCKKKLKYSIHYEISGNNSQIKLEPTCGELNSGEKVKLTIVVRPQLPEKVIFQTAKETKMKKLLEEKRLEWILQQEKAASTSSKIVKNDQMPDFQIDEAPMEINQEDMYLAEMTLWQTMEPYNIEAKFCCTVTFFSENFERNPEKLYISTECKVIKPAFCHNFQTQRIDFGKTFVGTSDKKVLEIQNILQKNIKPKVSYLQPSGSFSVLYPYNISLPPEHLLRLPITFKPSKTGKETQYVEIKAGRTICNFILTGRGIAPNISISPDFLVCRLEAKNGGFADCSFEINNQGDTLATIELVKLCELQGEIRPLSNPVITSTKGSASKKPPKMSSNLTDEEINSMKKYFSIKSGASYFEVVGVIDNLLTVESQAKIQVKVKFRCPANEEKQGNEELGAFHTCYAVKYNIMLKGCLFLKDFIILAKFI